MQILDDMNDCTGCSACFNVCPKAAIEMKSDVEGFKFPVIDADKCVNCGLCREVCPVVSARFENSAAPACYAAQGSDELRAASSSGGAFGILAESVLKEGGAVAGAVFAKIGRLNTLSLTKWTSCGACAVQNICRAIWEIVTGR